MNKQKLRFMIVSAIVVILGFFILLATVPMPDGSGETGLEQLLRDPL